MPLPFSRRNLPGGVQALVATMAISQGSVLACMVIALHLGRAWARQQEFSVSSVAAHVQRALVDYRVADTDPAGLLDAENAVKRVAGVQRVATVFCTPLLAGAAGAAAAGGTGDLTPLGALQEAMKVLGSRGGFLTAPHKEHTATLLPEFNSCGELVALTLFNFLGHYLLPAGTADRNVNYPGFAVRMEATQKRSMWGQVDAVMDSLYCRRYQDVESASTPLQIDVFLVDPGAWGWQRGAPPSSFSVWRADSGRPGPSMQPSWLFEYHLTCTYSLPPPI